MQFFNSNIQLGGGRSSEPCNGEISRLYRGCGGPGSRRSGAGGALAAADAVFGPAVNEIGVREKLVGPVFTINEPVAPGDGCEPEGEKLNLKGVLPCCGALPVPAEDGPAIEDWGLPRSLMRIGGGLGLVQAGFTACVEERFFAVVVLAGRENSPEVDDNSLVGTLVELDGTSSSEAVSSIAAAFLAAASRW